MSEENESPDASADGSWISDADPARAAELAREASDEQLAEAMADPDTRRKILDEIFKRMADHVEPDQIKDVDAVIHFKVTDAPGGGEDVYEAVFKDDAVSVNHEPTTDSPRVTISAAPVPFLRLVTGQASAPTMFMTGKLRISGDMVFAARMGSFFSVPSAP